MTTYEKNLQARKNERIRIAKEGGDVQSYLRNERNANLAAAAKAETQGKDYQTARKTVETPELDAAVGNTPDFVAPSQSSASGARQLTNEEQALEIMGLLNPVDFSPETVAQREWEKAGVTNAEEYRKVLPGIVQKDMNDLDNFLFKGGALLAAESGLENTVSSVAEAGRGIWDLLANSYKYGETEDSKNRSDKVSPFLLGFADEHAQASQDAMNIAKSNMTGTVGDVLLDATAAGTQMVGDIIIGAATGGTSKIPMAIRSFGAGVQQARQKGYTVEQQMALGLSSAAIEYITEKFFGGNPFYDTAEAGMINEAIRYFGGSKDLLNFLSSVPVETLNEGLEEILSGVLNPAMEYIIAGQSDPIVLEDLIKEGIIGVMLGGAGQVANATYNQQNTPAVPQEQSNPLLDALLGTETPLTAQGDNGNMTGVNGGVSNESFRNVSGEVDTGSRGVVQERTDMSGERRMDGGTASGLGGQPVSPQLRTEMNNKGIADLGLTSQTDGAFFVSSLEQAKALDAKYGVYVSPKTVEDMAGILQNGGKVFINENGSAGLAVTADGDIEAVFKNQQTGPKGAITDLMITALANGGTKLDCYGAGLVNKYAMFGFAPVAQVEFNPEYANPGWDLTVHGTPPVYIMMHNGDSADVVLQNRGQYHTYSQAELDTLPLFGKDDYDKAVEYRNDLLAGRSNRTVVNGQQDGVYGRSVGAATPAQGPQVPTQSKPITESNWMSEEEKARVAPDTHERIGRALREARAEAMFAMDSSGTIVNAPDVVADLLDMPFGSWNAVVQEGAMIAAQTPAVRSNEELFQAVFDRYVRERTEQARALQAGQDWMAHTPIGKVAEAIRAVNAINADGKNKVEFSDKEIKQVYALMEKSQQIRGSDPREAARLEAEADKILASKMPVSLKNKVIRFLMDNMLGNFRTLITRNAGGNLIFAVPESLSKLPTALVDKAVGAVTKERYYAAPDAKQAKAYGKGFAKGAKETIEDFRWDVHTPRSGETLDYSAQIKPFSNWACNALDKLVQTGLEVGDRPFYEANYNARMVELNKLRDMGKLPKDMMDRFDELAPVEARLTALEAVFQSEGKMAQGLNEIKSAVQNIIDAATGIGLGGQFSVPFTRTPGNILQRTLEYMPGISTVKNALTTGKEIADGGFDQRRFSREAGRNITGMGIAALASQAVAAGVITGGGDDRPDEELLEQSGWQEYSIKIGDKYFSYDWIPILGPLMAGTADFMGALDDDAENPLLNATGAGLQSTAEMSALSGMSRMFGGYSGVVSGLGDMLLGGTSQVIPSIVRQSARATDSYERSTYDPNTLKQQWNYIKSGIPGLRQTLPVQYDLFGNPVEISDGRGAGPKWFENLLSPSYVSEEQSDPRTDEMLRLRDAGYNVPVPEISKKRDIDGDGVNDALTAEEYSLFTQSRNSTFGELAAAIIGSDSYEAMSDQSMSLLLSEAMSYATKMATAELYKGRGEEYSLDKWIVNAAESSDPARYLQVYRTFTIASNDKHRDYDALDGVMDLYGQLSDADRESMKDSSSELERLYEASQEGVSAQNWYKVHDAVAALEPLDGNTGVTTYQKLEAVLESSSGKDTDVLITQNLSGLLPEKYEMVRAEGFSAEYFVDAYRVLNTVTGDGTSGSKKRNFIAALVEIDPQWERYAGDMYDLLQNTNTTELPGWTWSWRR